MGGRVDARRAGERPIAARDVGGDAEAAAPENGWSDAGGEQRPSTCRAPLRDVEKRDGVRGNYGK